MVGRSTARHGPARETAGPNHGHSRRLPSPCGAVGHSPYSSTSRSERGASGAPRVRCHPCRRRETPAARCRCRVRSFAVPWDSPPLGEGLSTMPQPVWLIEAALDRGGSISLEPLRGLGSAMHIIVVGLSHKTTPVDLREHLYFPEVALE